MCMELNMHFCERHNTKFDIFKFANKIKSISYAIMSLTLVPANMTGKFLSRRKYDPMNVFTRESSAQGSSSPW